MHSEPDDDQRARPTAVRFFAGHGGSPIWGVTVDRAGPIDPEDLGLSPALAARLRDWDTEITRHVVADQNAPHHLLDQRDALAHAVQSELWDVEVLVGDDRSGWHPIRG